MTIATEMIWHEFHERLRAFVSYRVDAQDVDDVLQEVFLRIHRGLSGVEQPERLQAWVYQITRNAIVDHYRRRSTRTNRETSRHEDAVEVPVEVDEDRDESRRDLARCLEPLVGQLPESYREAIVLTEFQGQTQQASAHQLGVSVSSMKSRVQRGRNKLKEMLLQCCQLEFDHRGTVVNYQARDGGCTCCGTPGKSGTCDSEQHPRA